MTSRDRRSRRLKQNRFVPRVASLERRQLLSTDVLTYHDNNSRTDADLTETTLTPANVNSADFGKVGFLAVDGKVDAQPLVKTGVAIPGQGTHDVVYVATEGDSVYAFDAESGALLWHDGPTSGAQALLGPGETTVPASDYGSDQIAPTIGITSTPVIDPATNAIYVVAMSKSVVGGTTTYFQRVHALDLGTGADIVAPRSVDGSISYPGKGPGGDGTNLFFNPRQYDERDALTLSDGVIYTGWASHSDQAPYTGWLIGFRATDLSLDGVVDINPNGSPAQATSKGSSGDSFWNSGAGFAADSAGNLYNISGSGPFDASLGDYGDSDIKFSTANNTLAVADYFSPDDTQTLDVDDLDLGSSGILLLPPIVDASGDTPSLAIGSGKDGNIYLVDRDNLGKFDATGNRIWQEVDGQLGGAVFGSPAYFDGTVYFGAVGASLRAFSIAGAKLSATPTSQSPEIFGYPGTVPAISADGSADGIVWAAENGTTGALHAYDAANLADELYDSNQAAGGRDQFGAGNKFITPTVANGRVYVGTTNGVAVFGLLSFGHPPSSRDPGAEVRRPRIPVANLLHRGVRHAGGGRGRPGDRRILPDLHLDHDLGARRCPESDLQRQRHQRHQAGLGRDRLAGDLQVPGHHPGPRRPGRRQQRHRGGLGPPTPCGDRCVLVERPDGRVLRPARGGRLRRCVPRFGADVHLVGGRQAGRIGPADVRPERIERFEIDLGVLPNSGDLRDPGRRDQPVRAGDSEHRHDHGRTEAAQGQGGEGLRRASAMGSGRRIGRLQGRSTSGSIEPNLYRGHDV